MKPPPFAYLRPARLDEALAALAEEGAQVLAGGQSLLPMLNMRLARPQLLIDIMRLPGLGEIRREGGSLVVGAAVRQAALETWAELPGTLPLLARLFPHIAHWQIRCRGTVCGSIAHADPAAELPLALLALGGTVRLASRKGRREVPAEQFFLGPMLTARRDDEMIEAVLFPVHRPGFGYAFREVARRDGDFALVALAAVAGPDFVRLAVGGVEDRPLLFTLPPATARAHPEALEAALAGLAPRGDPHAPASYREAVLRALAPRIIAEAHACRD